jgi:fido (protein-threonine AMPylation protein)
LIENAKKNIEGDISIYEVQENLNTYYQSKPNKTDNRTEEADKVSARITELLSNETFIFSPVELIGIHQKLFDGIYQFAGRIRDYNITKKERVLH